MGYYYFQHSSHPSSHGESVCGVDPFATTHALYIRNALTVPETGISRLETFARRPPDLRWLRAFGCAVEAYISKEQRYAADHRRELPRGKKLVDHAAAGIYLGSAYPTSGHMVYFLKRREVRACVHVAFDETSFPGIPETPVEQDEEGPQNRLIHLIRPPPYHCLNHQLLTWPCCRPPPRHLPHPIQEMRHCVSGELTPPQNYHSCWNHHPLYRLHLGRSWREGVNIYGVRAAQVLLATPILLCPLAYRLRITSP